MTEAPVYDHVLVIETRPGSWGRGKTLKDAIKASEYIGPGNRVAVFACTADAHVDGMGRMYGVDMASERRGKVLSGRTVKYDNPNQKGV